MRVLCSCMQPARCSLTDLHAAWQEQLSQSTAVSWSALLVRGKCTPFQLVVLLVFLGTEAGLRTGRRTKQKLQSRCKATELDVCRW